MVSVCKFLQGDILGIAALDFRYDLVDGILAAGGQFLARQKRLLWQEAGGQAGEDLEELLFLDGL